MDNFGKEDFLDYLYQVAAAISEEEKKEIVINTFGSLSAEDQEKVYHLIKNMIENSDREGGMTDERSVR